MTAKKLTNLAQLADADLISAADVARLRPIADRYAIAITPQLAEAIAHNPQGPLARQFLPDARELDRLPQERDDPIGDELKAPATGIVHRYPDRVLLKLVSVCPVYCRFCFRRETVGPGKSAQLSADEFTAALAYIAAHREIWEVIVTGGDPFILSPRRLAEVTQALTAIAHVKVIRWHTRVPVVAPESIDATLAAALKAEGKAVFVALHTNHADELTPAARQACTHLIDNGIAMVSQTVLLRGINDDAATLCDLMRALLETRIKPYYLHHGDLAPGTAHFRVLVSEGQEIVAAMRARLSGLAMPTYVLDIPGAHGKVPIGRNYVSPAGDGAGYVVTDTAGRTHRYEDVCASPSANRYDEAADV